MVGQSGLLTLLGMCVVFSFIIILICCMKLLHLFVRVAKLDNKEEKETSQPVNNVSNSDDAAIVAAIATAIREKTLN